MEKKDVMVSKYYNFNSSSYFNNSLDGMICTLIPTADNNDTWNNAMHRFDHELSNCLELLENSKEFN